MPGLTSEVTFTAKKNTIRKIPVGAILAMAMVGVTERGPIGTTLMLTDESEYTANYGGLLATSDTPLAAVTFLSKGGTRLFLSRVVHCTTPSDPTTRSSAKGTLTLLTGNLAASSGKSSATVAGPFDLEPGDTLIGVVDGGGPATATFSATAATRTAVNAATYALTNGWTLTLSVDGGGTQTVTFVTGDFASIGAATTAEVNAVINAALVGARADVSGGKPRITSDKRGTASGINIIGGLANGAFAFATGNTAGTGNVANIDAVTTAEFESIVEAAIAGESVTFDVNVPTVTSNTTGASSSVKFNTSNVATKLGFDLATHSGSAAGTQSTVRVDAKDDGAYAAKLSPVVAAGSASTKRNFNISRDGIIVERFSDIDLDPTSKRYIETVINDPNTGSKLVTVTDLEAVAPSPNNLPAVGTFGPLSGGSDGLSSLDDNDFIGGESDNGSTGMRVFDTVDIDLIAAPGRATVSTHLGLVTYCDITREGLCFAILDCPAGYSAAQMATYMTSTASLFDLTENAAIYWPRPQIANPDKSIYGADALITVPASGIMGAVYARRDASKVGGMFEQPAGTEVANLATYGVQGLETTEVRKKPKREILFPLNVNFLSKETDTGPIFVDGARNLSINGSWPSVGQRRGAIFVQKRLQPALNFVRHQNIKPALLEDARKVADDFLFTLTQEHCFASDLPRESYVVDFGTALNNAITKKARRVKGAVGIATATPAEFVDIDFGPDNSAFDAELAALAAA